MWNADSKKNSLQIVPHKRYEHYDSPFMWYADSPDYPVFELSLRAILIVILTLPGTTWSIALGRLFSQSSGFFWSFVVEPPHVLIVLTTILTVLLRSTLPSRESL